MLGFEAGGVQWTRSIRQTIIETFPFVRKKPVMNV